MLPSAVFSAILANMIKVFGHISPDTDTTGCAILWAWYLNNHTGHQATPYVLGTLNKETSFVLSHWGVAEPSLLEAISADDEVVIVDTNNPQELFENINDATILQIIDHHKLTGGLTSKGPLEMTIRPLASTATVMYDLMGSHTEDLPNDMAGIMLSCILSDTLEFRSPTTTPHDKDVAERLATKLGVTITDYANQLFAAKSDVSDFTDVGLIHIDSKKYGVGDKNFRVSVVETTTPETILARKEGIVSAIKTLLDEEKDVDEVLFFVIDIFKEEATVLTYSQLTKDIIEASFGVTVTGDTVLLPGVVSRKKQILPVLVLK